MANSSMRMIRSEQAGTGNKLRLTKSFRTANVSLDWGKRQVRWIEEDMATKIIIQIILPTLQTPIHSIARSLFTWALITTSPMGYFLTTLISRFSILAHRIIDLQVFPPTQVK